MARKLRIERSDGLPIDPSEEERLLDAVAENLGSGCFLCGDKLEGKPDDISINTYAMGFGYPSSPEWVYKVLCKKCLSRLIDIETIDTKEQ